MKQEHPSNEYCRDGTYQTGSTIPPKSHGGLLAVFLGLVIFVCGIITAMGLMNIKLTLQQTQPTDPQCAIAFARSAVTAKATAPLGFTGDTVTLFWQQYHKLPQGIYINWVDTACEAADKGLRAGDVLIQLDGTQLTDWDAFTSRLSVYLPGDTVSLTVYRSGRLLQYRLTVE